MWVGESSRERVRVPRREGGTCRRPREGSKQGRATWGADRVLNTQVLLLIDLGVHTLTPSLRCHQHSHGPGGTDPGQCPQRLISGEGHSYVGKGKMEKLCQEHAYLISSHVCGEGILLTSPLLTLEVSSRLETWPMGLPRPLGSPCCWALQ